MTDVKEKYNCQIASAFRSKQWIHTMYQKVSEYTLQLVIN